MTMASFLGYGSGFVLPACCLRRMPGMAELLEPLTTPHTRKDTQQLPQVRDTILLFGTTRFYE